MTSEEICTSSWWDLAEKTKEISWLIIYIGENIIFSCFNAFICTYLRVLWTNHNKEINYIINYKFFHGHLVSFISNMDASLDANNNVYSFMVSWLSAIERLLTEFEAVFTQPTVIWLYCCVSCLKMCFVLLLHVCSLALCGYLLTYWIHLNWAFENVIQALLIPEANNSSSSWQTRRYCAVCWEQTCQIRRGPSWVRWKRGV